jgi:hypothetical protein
MTIVRQRFYYTRSRGSEQTQNSPLLDNGLINKFLRQRIDAVTDELLEMMIYIRFAWKLVQESSFARNSSLGIHKRVQCQLWSVNQRTAEAEEVTEW